MEKQHIFKICLDVSKYINSICMTFKQTFWSNSSYTVKQQYNTEVCRSLIISKLVSTSPTANLTGKSSVQEVLWLMPCNVQIIKKKSKNLPISNGISTFTMFATQAPNLTIIASEWSRCKISWWSKTEHMLNRTFVTMRSWICSHKLWNWSHKK